MTTLTEVATTATVRPTESADEILTQGVQQLSMSSSASSRDLPEMGLGTSSTDSLGSAASGSATVAGRHGHLINKNIAEVEREVFVGDLSFFCKEFDLHTLFSQYGKVIGTRIRRSESTNQSLMYGFVKMETAEQAKAATLALENKMFMGRIMR